ncbi:MAG: 4,5-DOPA dioxygenase extradiol [Proteobacteria bacterium]|nr:4,5-DOPA dioxygenase extradiol [Pseudomonadota bacterium]
MPVLFIGHGSPMNALATNRFTQTLAKLGQEIPKPKAILCISAHWLTEGSWLTNMEFPRTIHDFYGFPQPLFDIRYDAPGSQWLALQTQKTVQSYHLQLDNEMWGLDHGTWSVLRHMYPKADIPVVQLSINQTRTFEFHYELGQQLRALREEGVLIVGSGNIVHNLRTISWDPEAKAFDWATEFDEWVKSKLEKKDFTPLIQDSKNTEAGKLSIPTDEHYIPLLYALGASKEEDQVRFVYEGIENASISMRTVLFQS